MRIKLIIAYGLLSRAAGIVTDQGLTAPSLYEINVGGLHEFCILEQTDDDGLVYKSIFLEKDNQEVLLVNSSLFLKNSDGEEIQITLLKEWEVESELVFEESAGITKDYSKKYRNISF